jgi:site-specific DNA-methyltransferase (adenine-specific)
VASDIAAWLEKRDSATPVADYHEHFVHYSAAKTLRPVFLCGDARTVLAKFPSDSIDCCMTSPPYWGKRVYNGGGIGLETEYRDYTRNLVEVFREVHRVLKPTGSFWLNLGDTYLNKRLLGIPWRVAIELMDQQGWILRNDIIWNKVKGGLDNSTDKLRNVHEYVFHFVKNPRRYYFNADEIRTAPRQAKVVNGAVVSATGVSGIRYRRQIELSTSLTPEQKKTALHTLNETLAKVQRGEISDFRMIIRGTQRTTHSDSSQVSGRAKELEQKGCYILRYHPNGSKPSDVWDILPEDTQSRSEHYAAYPEDLCKIPILATCPPGAIVLDPFCGTGTTMVVACRLARKSVGIDVSPSYIKRAEDRANLLL